MITNANISFPKKRASDSLIYEYLTPQSYADLNSQTSCLFEIFKLNATAISILTSKIL